jgi:hypothetical protein
MPWFNTAERVEVCGVVNRNRSRETIDAACGMPHLASSIPLQTASCKAIK